MNLKENNTLYDQLLIFGAITMVAGSITICILYILCTRKSRLNWFENTTLQNASNVNKCDQALLSVYNSEPRISESNIKSPSYKYTLIDNASECGNNQSKKGADGEGHFSLSRQSSVDTMTPVTCSQKHLILSSVPLAIPKVAFVQSKGDQDPLETEYTYTAESQRLLRLLEV